MDLERNIKGVVDLLEGGEDEMWRGERFLKLFHLENLNISRSIRIGIDVVLCSERQLKVNGETLKGCEKF